MYSDADAVAPAAQPLTDLVGRIRQAGGPHIPIGCGSPLGPILHELETLASTEAPAVFWGEPGAGRRTLARALHALSRRRAGPFVTWRVGEPKGLSSAGGGTMLIEDLSGLPDAVQADIVAHLDGAHALEQPDGRRPEARARVLAISVDAPQALVLDDDLSEDLYHRLSVFVIKVPPLRARPSDVVAISRHVVRRANAMHRLSVRGFSSDTIDRLQSAPWPGNVPELRKVVEHAAIRARRGRIHLEHLPGERGDPDSASSPAHLVLPVGITAADAERRLVLATLEQTGFNKSEAARRLGMDVKTVRNKLKTYGLPDRIRRGHDRSSSPGQSRH